ncbi:MAG: hypothetical protein ACREYF_10295 [Gammaproteobacteria bacterium]
MKRSITDCDRCTAQDCLTEPVWIDVGTQIDTASARTEPRAEELDLCMSCLAIVLRQFVEKLSIEQGRELIQRIRRRPGV